MAPWFFWDCIGHQLFRWCFASIFVSLICIVSIHVSSYLFCYSWPPVIPGDQLYCLPSPSVPFYQGVIVQSYYFPPEFSFWHVYPSFFYYYPIFYFLFFIFQCFYSCPLQLFYCFYYLFILFLYLFDSFLQVPFLYYRFCFPNLFWLY